MKRAVWAALWLVAACGDGPGDGDPSSVTIQVERTLMVVEGESATFVVKLAADPGEDVTLDVAVADAEIATASPAQITLTSETYATGAIVSVVAREDENLAEDGTDIRLTTERAVTQTLRLRVVDNDVQAIAIDKTSLSLVESATGTFGVRLSKQPSEATVVTLSSDAPSIAAISPATLTFLPGDYAVAQTVTVTAVPDSDLKPGSAHISVTGGGGLDSQGVGVSVVDDDTQALVVSSATPVVEGSVTTFDISLAFEPLVTTTVTIQSSDPTALMLTMPDMVTFDTTDWATPKTITLAAPEDGDALDEAVTLTLNGPSVSTTAQAKVLDNDSIQVATSLLVWEGSSAMLAVTLANDPGPAGRVVTVQATGDAMVSPTTLAFTSANYATGLQVEVQGLVDATSTTDKQATLRLSSPDQTERQVAVTIGQRIPGSLSSAITLTNPYAGGVGSMDLRFWTSNPWPGDGKLIIAMSSTFDVSGVTFETSSLDGQFGVSVSGSTITLTRTNGTAATNSVPVTIRLGNLKNPPYAGGGIANLETRTALDGILDGGWASVGASAAPFVELTRSLSTTTPGATGEVTVTFRTVNPWPANGWIELWFPWSLNLTMTSLWLQTGVDGSFSFVFDQWTNKIAMQRSGGTTVPAGTLVSLTFRKVGNPATAESFGGILVRTETSTAQWIDTGTTPDITIGCPASITKRTSHSYEVSRNATPWDRPWQLGTGGGSHITALQGSSNYLVADGFGFVLPETATVTGIAFGIYKDSGGASVVDDGIRIVRPAMGQVDRSTMAAWNYNELVTHGGPGDLWGETWSAADVASASFGVAMAVRTTTFVATSQLRITNVTSTVYLSCP